MNSDFILTADSNIIQSPISLKPTEKAFNRTTPFIGILPEETNISGSNAQPGDVIILSGSIGEHGITIMSRREGLKFSSHLESD